MTAASPDPNPVDPDTAHPGSPPRRLVAVAAVLVLVRVVVVGVLAFGPWTDEAGELAGWDIERFQVVADLDGRPYVDQPVEYPPGSVVAIELVAGGDLVTTHRVLAVASLLVDLAIAAALARWWRPSTGVAYLLAGLPLVPMGYVRFDLWATALAVLAAAALVRNRVGATAAATTAGALVKVWPVMLVAAAVAVHRTRAAVVTVLTGAAAGIVWLAYAGGSLDPVDQVVSLRGATGWHVESLAGSLIALTTDATPTRQLDAFRIGTLDPRLVLLGRLATLAAVAGLVMLGRRGTGGTGPAGRARDELVVGAVTLGATAAMVVTAPLLSPQFLLWLTPWLAIVATSSADGARAVTWASGIAIGLTGLVLAVWSPPELAGTAPALLLLARDAALVAVVVSTARLLRRCGPPTTPAPDRAGTTADG
ncbi:MAG: hypothetical protein ACK5PP_06075 [Acidimicrobiales bacterium]